MSRRSERSANSLKPQLATASEGHSRQRSSTIGSTLGRNAKGSSLVYNLRDQNAVVVRQGNVTDFSLVGVATCGGQEVRVDGALDERQGDCRSLWASLM